ncbi:signal recognition particle protein [Blattabacterium cuenoti]|uniref:signal recognition particle protein n=1 Tax=Blattabacterium cuenoti TaxID=1653831 RepID=UPI00163CB422|nr:signal recognition particle protein [Blattabacterium cuenoti]
MFENLRKKFSKAFHILKGDGEITDVNIAETMKEIRRSLIEADVNYKIAKNFVQNVRRKSIGKKVPTSLNPKNLIVKLVYDELVDIMGGENIEKIKISSDRLSVILVCGLQGSGKTTFSSKLAFFLRKKENKNPLLVAADVYRPAAIDQLNILSSKVNLPVFFLKENKNVIEIIEKSILYAEKNKHNVIIIDTAGRLSIDQMMMNEIQKIYHFSKPDETLFIVDSMTGQDAINTAKNFLKFIEFDGIVMTKLDGDSRGGAAITMSSVIGKPIKFISNGEKIENIEIFYPERIANRILGMGDIVSLVEKVQEQFDEERTKKIYKKISKNRFNFEDLLEQIKRIKKIGSIKNIFSMIPGMENFLDFHNEKKDSFKNVESIIFSMTPYERNNPKSLNNIKRRKRISKGSGVSLREIDLFLKQFDKISKVMKSLNDKSGSRLIKDFLSKMITKQSLS